MQIFEVTLLIITYSLMLLTIFVQIVCYKRNLENLETIGLTVSLLFLILTLTSSYFIQEHDSESTGVFTLLAMILVAAATPINVLIERKHRINSKIRLLIISLGGVLFLTTILSAILLNLIIIQYVVVVFLVLSILLSMILIRVTKPNVKIAHREKIDRWLALAIMIVVPLSLAANYLSELNGLNNHVGFTLPMVFLVLTGSKLLDDIQRLSLFNPRNVIEPDSLANYAFTSREGEIAELLVKGKTYKQISEQLFISIPTVKTHVSNIYKKSKARNKVELIALLIN
ncbi:MAG: helix-turn-helix transcriptional regulator [bacterium]|nr:helix-turn-helix transcriptional regulator [bacterium]